MELRKIIVGIDFSSASEAATREAVELSRHTGAELVLVHVGAVLDAPLLEDAPGASMAEWEQVLRERLATERQQIGELRQRLIGQGVDVSTIVIDGFPDTGLIEAARELDAELIVTGSHGRTGLRRFLLGSVAERVVRQSEACVLVSRPGGNVSGGYHRILVPTDFSPHAEDALRMALITAAHGATVELVHFWQLPPIATGYEVSMMTSGTALLPLRSAIVEESERSLRTLVERYQHCEVELRWDLIEDRAAHGIAERARGNGHPYDVIVMGGHGRRGVRRWVLGSVTEATVRHVPCSVMVVHRRRRDGEE